jgi:hypothetical protein
MANRYLALVNGVITMVQATISSSGSSSSGQIVALNAAGAVDITMMPTGIGANTVSAVASAALTAGMLVNIYNNGGVLTVRPADSTTAGSEANGYVIAGFSSGATATVYVGGGLINGLSGLTVGSTYYLGTVGAATTAVPATAGNIVQYVGKAVSTTALEFQPSLSPVTVA